MPLFLLCGRVALFNQCIAQADTFFTEAIDAIEKVPAQVVMDRSRRSSEPILMEIVANIIGALVIAPGHPQEGPFFLTKRLLNVLGEYSWQSGARTKISLYLRVARLLCAYSQKRLPYHVAAVESNDTLYAGAAKYQQELQEMLKVVMGAIVTMLQKASSESDGGGAGNNTELGMLQLELFYLIVSQFRFTLDDDNNDGKTLAKTASQAFKSALAVRSQTRAYRRFIDQTRDYLQCRVAEAEQDEQHAQWAKTLTTIQKSLPADGP